MQKTSVSRNVRIAGIALLIAAVVVLQIISSFIKPGGFSISLALVPIVVGAAMYGASAGAVLGITCGVVVLINCINGVDAGGYMLWAANPLLTSVLCLVKGGLAGCAAGIVYSALSSRNRFLGVVCAALACPVVNTGIFIAAMVFFYRETLVLWAGDSPILYYAFVGLAGINFLLETTVNLILSPAVVRVIQAVGRRD
jgi:thiamine transporter ThiT